MVGDADSTVSPSSSSTRRRTPCVLGCCGPMFTVITSVLISGIGVTKCNHEDTKTRKTQRCSLWLRGFVAASCRSSPRQPVSLDVCAEFVGRHLQRLGVLRRHADLHRIVLPQRMPFPVFRHEQTTRIGMAVER